MNPIITPATCHRQVHVVREVAALLQHAGGASLSPLAAAVAFTTPMSSLIPDPAPSAKRTPADRSRHGDLPPILARLTGRSSGPVAAAMVGGSVTAAPTAVGQGGGRASEVASRIGESRRGSGRWDRRASVEGAEVSKAPVASEPLGMWSDDVSSFVVKMMVMLVIMVQIVRSFVRSIGTRRRCAHNAVCPKSLDPRPRRSSSRSST